MSTDRSLGRTLGLSMLATFVVGLVSNFKLQDGLFADGGLLVNAAAHPLKIGLICLLGLGTSLFSLWVAGRLESFFPRSELLRFYRAVLVAGLAMTLVEFSTLLAFRELSQAHLVAGGTGAHPVVAVALSGLRNGVHFLDKLVGGFSVLLLFGFLYSARVLPRAIAVAGMAGALAQMFAVGRALFGFEVAYGLLVPLSLAFLVTMGWLLARGFTVREDAPA